MKLSKLTISCLMFIVLFLFLTKSYPNILQQDNQEKCFMSFFLIGIAAIIIYNLVDSFYK